MTDQTPILGQGRWLAACPDVGEERFGQLFSCDVEFESRNASIDLGNPAGVFVMLVG